MILVSIINDSATLKGRNLVPILEALAKQLFRDALPVYGQVPALELATMTDRSPDADAIIFIVDEPDIDGALGYHDEVAGGLFYAKIFVKPIIENGGSLQTGANSVSATISHELLEMLGDESANKWADRTDSLASYAFELCDAVQNDSYDIDGVAVSNFVYPAFFDEKAAADSRFDYLGKLSAPFEMTSGGYQIVRDEYGIKLIYGKDFPTWQKEMKEKGFRLRQRVQTNPLAKDS